MLALLPTLILSVTLHGVGWLTGEQPSPPMKQVSMKQAPTTQGAKPASRSAAAAKQPVWLDVPFVAQTTDGCGSAALAMVIRYWQRQQHQPMTADPVRLQQQLFSRHAHGIYASRMVDQLRRMGFAAYPFHGQWSDLIHHIALGRPLLAAVRDDGAHGPLHSVVVVGAGSYGAGSDFVYLNDPARQQKLRLSRAAFLAEWSATEDWTLLAVPESRSSATPRTTPTAEPEATQPPARAAAH
jgi:uncharacterized protein YvpB